MFQNQIKFWKQLSLSEILLVLIKDKRAFLPNFFPSTCTFITIDELSYRWRHHSYHFESTLHLKFKHFFIPKQLQPKSSMLTHISIRQNNLSMFKFFENPGLFKHKLEDKNTRPEKIDRKLLNQGKQLYERVILQMDSPVRNLLPYEVFWPESVIKLDSKSKLLQDFSIPLVCLRAVTLYGK